MCGRYTFLYHLPSPLVTSSLPVKGIRDSSFTVLFGSFPYQGDWGKAACSRENCPTSKEPAEPPARAVLSSPCSSYPQRAVGSKKEGTLKTQLPLGTRKPSNSSILHEVFCQVTTTTRSTFFCHGNSTQPIPMLFVLLSLRRERWNIMCWYSLKSSKRFTHELFWLSPESYFCNEGKKVYKGLYSLNSLLPALRTCNLCGWRFFLQL